MGAAGFVNIYRDSEVRNKYKELFPGGDIDEDWWYLKTITVELDGEKWILDYYDDQGCHEGTNSDFWFRDAEAQRRVNRVLAECKAKTVEVWT